MRVSTNSQYLTGTFSLQQQQFRLNTLQNQLSNMKRVVNPSDDPVASAQILNTSLAKSVNEQFTKNSQTVTDRLALSDTTLQGASEAIHRMKELAIKAGNGTYTIKDFQAIQSEFRELVQDFVGLANSTDNSGNYMYAGTKINQKPYVLNISAGIDIQYQGDTGRAEVQVSVSRSLAVTDPGADMFGSTSTASPTVYLPVDATATPPVVANTLDPNAASKGNELLQAIKRFDQILSTPPSGTNPVPSLATSLAAVIDGFDTGLQNVLTGLARVGARMEEASTLETQGGSLDVQYNIQISHMQDLDVAQTISDFQLTLQALQATQNTYQKVSSLSLFQYL